MELALSCFRRSFDLGVLFVFFNRFWLLQTEQLEVTIESPSGAFLLWTFLCLLTTYKSRETVLEMRHTRQSASPLPSSPIPNTFPISVFHFASFT
jgi:hypothetical protein